MASSASLIKLAIAAVAMVVLASSPREVSGTVTCGQVVQNLSPCLLYLKNGGPVPTPCCDGIRKLKQAAATPVDRQAACTCMKDAATRYPGINPNNAGQLPRLCQVSIPYPISPSVDCSKVH